MSEKLKKENEVLFEKISYLSESIKDSNSAIEMLDAINMIDQVKAEIMYNLKVLIALKEKELGCKI